MITRTTDPSEAVAQTCGALKRNLTAEELAQFFTQAPDDETCGKLPSTTPSNMCLTSARHSGYKLASAERAGSAGGQHPGSEP